MTRKLTTALGLLVGALLWVGLLSLLFDRSVTASKPADDGSQAVIKYLDKSQFLRADAGEVSLRMDILDPRGVPVLGLLKDMVTVTEHGQAATISDFKGPGTQPINAILVIDISGSMGSGEKMEGAISAALAALEELMVGRDRIGIIAFDHTYDIVQPLERLTEQVKLSCQREISRLSPRGGTVIGIPTQAGLQMFGQDGIDGSKILMVMTDGEDQSLPALVDSIAELSDRMGVPVYTIGFGDLGNPDTESVLRNLSEKCIAEYYHAPTAEQLANIYRSQLQDLTQEFTVVYDSPFPQPDGLPRHVQVEIASPAGTLLAEASYEIGAIIHSGRGARSSEDESSPAIASDVSGVFHLLFFWLMFSVLAAALLAPSMFKFISSGNGFAGLLAASSPRQQTSQPGPSAPVSLGPPRTQSTSEPEPRTSGSMPDSPSGAAAQTSHPAVAGRGELKSKPPPPAPTTAKRSATPQRQQPADFKASEKKRIRPLKPPPPPPGSSS